MSGQPPYNQPNQPPNLMYPGHHPSMRMQQPFGNQPMGQSYGQPSPYMLGQPAPQMTGGLVNQPRSPMVQNLQNQGPTTGQPSPLAGGPHSHLAPGSIGPGSIPAMGPGSIGPHGGPHSTGPLSVHGNPQSTGPGSVLGPNSVPSSLLGGPHSLGPSMGGGPPSVINPQSTGGPGSVLTTGPLSNLAQSGPLSVHGGPGSTGDFLGNPQSVHIPQPLSVPRTNEDPRSVGPHSVNQPTTPMNPSSTQMNQSHTPATPAQAQKDPIPEQSVLTATDPMMYARDLIMKDIRHSIMRYNISVADYIKDRRGEGTKPPAQIKEDFIRANDALLAIIDDCDNSLHIILEAAKYADRLDKSASYCKEKLDTPMQASIIHKEKEQELIRNICKDASVVQAKLKARESLYQSSNQQPSEEKSMEY